MADVTGVLQKQIRRKFKGLTLSKNDRTADENFEALVTNFNKQQKNADRLHKELSKYVNCVKATATACRSFYEAVREVYEPDWDGVEHIKAITQSVDLLWEDFHDKLVDQALNPLVSYTNKFPEVKAKIDKRGRKLLDFDVARHDVETKTAAAKRDEGKIAKASEKCNDSKRLFEEINSELLVELPQLYDDRIPFYAANFQLIFHLEQTFHSETAKLSEEASNHLDKLGETSHNRHSTRNDVRPSPKPVVAVADKKPKPSPEPVRSETPPTKPKAEPEVSRPQGLYPAVPAATTHESKTSLNPFDDETPEDESAKPPPYSETDTNPPVTANGKLEASTAKVLYKVRATHKYSAEDSDEISFEAGEVISVIPFDDSDEQDDGWLLGFKESTGDKGVFPANFTKEI